MRNRLCAEMLKTMRDLSRVRGGAGAVLAAALVGLVAAGSEASMLRLPPELARLRLAFGLPNGIYEARADGSGLRLITRRPPGAYQPDWAPDGRRLLLRVDPQPGGPAGGVWIVSRDGSGIRNVTRSFGRQAGNGDWAPDGRRFVFNGKSRSDRFFNIYAAKLDGSRAVRLTPDQWEAQYPAWSPDGRKIAFTRVVPPSTFDIYVMNADGTQLKQLTRSPAQENWPEWSPDGSRIVFSSDDLPGGGGLKIMNADGSRQRVLTTNAGEPAWSPDGRWIAFDCSSDPVGHICAIRPDGRDRRMLLTPRLNAGFPAWLPRSRRPRATRITGSAPLLDPKLAVVTYSRGGDLWIVQEGGVNRWRLTRTRAWIEFDPSLSPDRTRVVYRRQARTGTSLSELFVLRLNGAASVRVSPAQGGEAPAWSPAGDWIAFSNRNGLALVDPVRRRIRSLGAIGSCPTWSTGSTRLAYCGSGASGGTSLGVVDATGKSTRVLLDNGAENFVGGWSRDGRRLVFTSDMKGSPDLYTIDVDRRTVRPLLVRPGVQAANAWLRDGRVVFSETDPRTGASLWKVLQPPRKIIDLGFLAGASDPIDWHEPRRP